MAQRPDGFDHVAYSVGAAGLVAGVRVFESVVAEDLAGHTSHRRMEQMNEDDCTSQVTFCSDAGAAVFH